MENSKDMLKSSVENRAKIMFIASVLIFSTIGVFRRNIDLSSNVITFYRSAIGTVFLFLVMAIKRQKLDYVKIKEKLKILIISGVCLGLNWVLLLESFEHTTVATATLCYYMAPIIVIVASSFIFNEKLDKIKILCISTALVGMVLISGVFSADITGLKGIILGLGAAVFYASITIINKKLTDVPVYDKTIVQLISSTVVMIIYILIQGNVSEIIVTDYTNIKMLLIVGIINTGIAYGLYFEAVGKLKAQSVAIYSYIDPLGAIILSAIILNETLGFVEIVGVVLILGATVFNDLYKRKDKEETKDMELEVENSEIKNSEIKISEVENIAS